MAGIWNKIRNAFKAPDLSIPPVPKPDALVQGHRGVALGLGNADRPTTKPTNRGILPPGEVAAFVYEGEPLFVNSSNVAMMQYHPETQKLMVEYLGKKGRPGGAYLYSNVTEAEAIVFAQAHSKGTAVWDMLRIRGTRHGHRKPFVKIR